MKDKTKNGKEEPQFICPGCSAPLKQRKSRKANECELICGGCGAMFDVCDLDTVEELKKHQKQLFEKGANFYYLRKTYQAFKNSHRRKFENTATFKKRYRMRSGIEGAISELDRRTGIKHLRVRGLAAVRFCMNLKAAGLNIFRSSTFAMLLKKQKTANCRIKKTSEKYGQVLFMFIYRQIYNICPTILQFRLAA